MEREAGEVSREVGSVGSKSQRPSRMKRPDYTLRLKETCSVLQLKTHETSEQHTSLNMEDVNRLKSQHANLTVIVNVQEFRTDKKLYCTGTKTCKQEQKDSNTSTCVCLFVVVVS